MMLSLRFREHVRKVSHPLLLELEQLVQALRAYLYTEHADDGTHGAVTATSVSVSTFTTFAEMTAPESAGANTGRVFVRDNGSGKSQLCVIFGSGAVQVIATEP